MKAIGPRLNPFRFRAATRHEQAVLIGPVAFVVGVAGEIALLQQGGEFIGSVLLFISALLAAFSWSNRRGLPTSSLTPGQEALTEPRMIRRRGTFLQIGGVGVALLLATGSIIAWMIDPGAIFGLQGLLWLAGICLLAVSCADRRRGNVGRTSPSWSRAEAATLVGLVALACITYLTALNDIPWRFHYDEAIAYEEAMRFYRGPQSSLFTTTWYGTGLPSLWFAISGALMNVGGTGLGGVRLGVALVGVATVLPVYGLGKLLLGRAGAVIAALSLATAPVVIHYSRVSITNSTTAFAWAVCFYFLLKGVSAGKPSDFAWAGLAAGLSMYTYYGTRLLPYLLLLFVAYLAIFHHKLFKARLAGIALLFVGFLVGFGPLLGYFMRNPDTWAGRGLSALNVPPTLPTTVGGWASVFQTLAPLVRLNFLGLSVIPSADNVYWGALMQPAEVVLLAMGLGVLLGRWRQPAAFLVVMWGVSVLFIGGTLIDAGHIPAFVHWAPAFPAFFIALAFGPALWLKSLQQAGRRLYRAGLILVSAGVALLAATNMYYYFVTYPTQVPPSFEAAQGRLLESLGPRDRVLFVGNSWQPFYKAIGEMVAPQVPASDLLNPSRSLPLVLDGRDLTFVFNDDEAQYLPVIQAYYPGGTTGPISTPGGPIAITYNVTAAEAQKKYGVNLDVVGGGGEKWSGVVQQVGKLPVGMRATYPITATWSGAFFVAADDDARLSVEGLEDRDWNFRLQEAPIQRGTQIYLNRGWIPFSLEARLVRFGEPRLLMQQSGFGAQEISSGRLWPFKAGSGLSVTVSGSRPFRRIDPFVGASILGGWEGAYTQALSARDPDFVALALPGGDADQVRWEGEVYAQGGAYNMELRTDASARLTIDGKEVIYKCAGPDDQTNKLVSGGYLALRGGLPPAANRVELLPGWHSVLIELDGVGRTDGLEWTWTRPDGVREIVPPGRLRHQPGAWPDSPKKIDCPR